MPYPDPANPVTRSFTRLTEHERRILALLAQGHTVKSIATITSWSVASVNERLREARRKTGVGSSRELARLLRAHENRDEILGMASSEGSTSTPLVPPTHVRGSKGKTAMIILTLGSLAAAAAALQPSSNPTPVAGTPSAAIAAATGDQRLDRLLMDADIGPSELHAKLSGEPRDPAWAPATEALLLKRYAALPHFDVAASALRVTCRTSLCEVVGRVAPAGTSSGATNAAMDDLQSKMFKQMALDGLESPGAAFGAESFFVTYWRKSAPVELNPGSR